MVKPPNSSGKRVTGAPPVESLIHVIRGQKVMLDRDLAALYGVTTKAFNQAIKRNAERFPRDFMFRLDHRESAILRSQSVTSSKRKIEYQPLAFTEHGVAMLSAVLRSDRAIQMSIGIIRAFVRMRQMIETNKDIAIRVEKLERGHERSASVIDRLVADPPRPRIKPQHLLIDMTPERFVLSVVWNSKSSKGDAV